MVAARASPEFMVVEGSVDVDLTGDALGPEWVSIECASKEAYGCGDLGKKLLEGITLYAHRLGCADLNSSLSIGLSDEAVRSIQAELDVPDWLQFIKKEEERCLPETRAHVCIADRGVLVFFVVFHCWGFGKRSYYLVYDATDASLYMIPYIPRNLGATCTMTPVPARPTGGRGHVLALSARKLRPQPGGAERRRLCVCTPATRANSASKSNDVCTPATRAYSAPDDGTGPWEVKVFRGFPNLPQGFSADVMFSSADMVFWADLAQGIAYSDLRQSGPDACVTFVDLPDGYVIRYKDLPKDAKFHSAKVSRTMGCVDGSIKFVCINRDETCDPGKEVVKVWTLDLDREQWKEEEDLTCHWNELWKKVCFMKPGLGNKRPLQPQYPVLMQGGALCLVLPKTRHIIRRRVKMPDYICSFDMHSKNCLYFGQVRNYHVMHKPVILPFNFFKNCYPAYKRKPPTLKRKLPSIDMQMPTCNLAVAQ